MAITRLGSRLRSLNPGLPSRHESLDLPNLLTSTASAAAAGRGLSEPSRDTPTASPPPSVTGPEAAAESQRPGAGSDAAHHSVERLRDWWRAPTSAGPCYVARSLRPRPPESPAVDLATLLADPRLSGFDPDQTLYLDIEATGLSHGAGTFAFLIGCAYVEKDQLVLEQLFMRDPTDERPVLERFLELLERFPFLVSYNGKSYDLSVLQSRLVITRLLSRLETELKVRPHLDLLHVSRQAYVGVFEDTKLQTIERRVLRIDPRERQDDVPGSMVPALYFHYLQTGYAPQLDPVLKHNATDVLSMVTLTHHLLALFDDPSAAMPRVRYNLGRAALRRKLHHRAVRLIASATAVDELAPAIRRKALADLVVAARRAGSLDVALQAAQDLWDATPSAEPDERNRLVRQIRRFSAKLGHQRALINLDTA